jgi:hypothetical protein
VAIPKALKQEIQDEALRDAHALPRLSGSLPDFRDALFAKQVRIFNDPAERVFMLSGRRFGKTAAFGRKAAQLCINKPHTNVVYTARSLRNAKKIIFPELEVLRDRYNVPIRFKGSNDDVTARFPGDSEILFMGIEIKKRVDILRGYGKDVELIGLDELGVYEDWLEFLIEKGAHALTADCAGQMWLMGNPGELMNGWWYEHTRPEADHEYPVYHGTGLENPYLQNALAEGQFVDGVNLKFRQWLADYRRKNKISEDDPTYRQEWLGEWCQNVDALMFDYSPERNAVPELPGLPGALDGLALVGPDWAGLDA